MVEAPALALYTVDIEERDPEMVYPVQREGAALNRGERHGLKALCRMETDTAWIQSGGWGEECEKQVVNEVSNSLGRPFGLQAKDQGLNKLRNRGPEVKTFFYNKA